jgi:hypothetical protein
MRKFFVFILLVATIAFLLFMGSGFFFASTATRAWAEAIWLGTFALLSVSITGTTIVYGAMLLRKKNAELHRYTPDENGNFPIVKFGKGLQNLNLLGADIQAQEWAFWQLTNNRSGTQPRELFQNPILAAAAPAPLQLIGAPGESDVIDAVAEEL